MVEEPRRPASVRRRIAVVAALASLVALLLALAPGTASAGLAGNSNLTVSGSGPGSGSVRAVQTIYGPNYTSAINCTWNGLFSSGLCSEQAPFGEPPEPIVVLQAFPQAGSTFVQWSVSPGGNIFGASCGTQAVCYVQLNGDTSVTATFNQQPGFPLTVVKAGPAATTQGVAVTSTSVPPQANQFNCGVTCTAQSVVFTQGTVVSLTVTAPAGVTWTWGGGAPAGCGPNQVTCATTVNSVTSLTITFNTATFTLQVTETGQGGIVSNIQPGIHCGDGSTICTATFAVGTQVVLTGTPDSGFTFQGWSGGCSGTATCTVTGNSGQTIAVTGTFASTTVQANVRNVTVTYNGPSNRQRAINATVNGQQPVTVIIRISRQGSQVAQRTFNNVSGVQTLRVSLRNGLPAGSYQVRITFTNDFGTTKQAKPRNVRVRAVS